MSFYQPGYSITSKEVRNASYPSTAEGRAAKHEARDSVASGKTSHTHTPTGAAAALQTIALRPTRPATGAFWEALRLRMLRAIEV